MAGDRRVLQADEALADIHTSPPILRGTSDVVDSFPAVAPLRHTYSAAGIAPHPAVSSQDDQDNPAQRGSEVVAGVVLAAVVGAEGVVVVEVVAVVAADGLRRRTVWYAMLPPVGQYR